MNSDQWYSSVYVIWTKQVCLQTRLKWWEWWGTPDIIWNRVPDRRRSKRKWTITKCCLTVCRSIEKRHGVWAGASVAGVQWLFMQHVSDIWWCSTAVTVVAQTSYLVSASYFDIICRTKQQWVTEVNSWQNKSRYKCGSSSTCLESTNRCQTTQFNVAYTSNIGDMCIHSKMTVQCKTQIFHKLFEGNFSITYSDRSRLVMEMLRSLRGDKQEFCLTVIKFKHVRSCPSFDITYTWLHRVK